jgi:hypothetical protein
VIITKIIEGFIVAIIFLEKVPVFFKKNTSKTTGRKVSPVTFVVIAAANVILISNIFLKEGFL